MSSGTDQAQSWGLVKCTSDCLHDLIVVGCCIFIGGSPRGCVYFLRYATPMRCDVINLATNLLAAQFAKSEQSFEKKLRASPE